MSVAEEVYVIFLFRLATSLYIKVTKKFSEWKQTHVRMELSKTSQTRWEQHHNTFTLVSRSQTLLSITTPLVRCGNADYATAVAVN